ncbi:MAG: hypothetical protein HW408_285 [Actinobacteria bacterium]|nr:hypothetical protein [Actinomycetota bacterium]
MAAETAEAGTEYKVAELTDVTDQAMEETLNRWTAEGYRFESIHFVTQPGNRRPAMAFIFFTRGAASGGA